MTDTRDPDGPPSSSGSELDPKGEDAVRELLRGALGASGAPPDLTRGVQQKIRRRSGGKFYADGWSTAKHPPRSTYLITSLMMLFVLLVIYALLSPLSGVPEPAPKNEPVHVVPPPAETR